MAYIIKKAKTVAIKMKANTQHKEAGSGRLMSQFFNQVLDKSNFDQSLKTFQKGKAPQFKTANGGLYKTNSVNNKFSRRKFRTQTSRLQKQLKNVDTQKNT